MKQSRLPWRSVALSAIGQWGSGGTPKSKDASLYGGDIPWIRSGDLPDDFITSHSIQISQAGLQTSSARWVAEGSILIAMYGATIGRLGLTTYPVTTNQAVAFCIPDENVVDPKFLFWYLLSKRSNLIALGQGGAQPNISQEIIKKQTIALPSVDLQKKIASKLDTLMKSSLRARGELEKVPGLIGSYKEAILAAAFKGELTLDWRKENPSENSTKRCISDILREKEAERRVRKLRNKGKNRSITGREHVLPTIPDSWAWVTFDHISYDLTVGHVGPMKERYTQTGIPFLRSLNVRPNLIDYETKIVFIDEQFHDELEKSKLSPGDLVVVRTGEPGIAAVIPTELRCANCSDLVIARLIPSVNPHYAAYYMNSDFAKAVVRDAQVGVAQQHFNVGSMSEMPCPYAPRKEQDAIVSKIKSAFDWLDRVVSEQQKALKLLPMLDQSILRSALEGSLPI